MKSNLTIMILLLTQGFLLAQTSGQMQVSISVSATVTSITQVEIITLQNIKIRGGNAEMGQIFISPITNPDAGLMKLKGQPGSNVRINYMGSDELTDENGSGSISINFLLSENNERIQSASKLIDTGEVIIHFDQSGESYLWVGGSLNLGNVTSGRFIGQFTIEIEYM